MTEEGTEPSDLESGRPALVTEEIQEAGDKVAAGQPLFGRPDSVQQCLAIMAEVSAEQRARARHLDTKTSTQPF